MADKILNVRIQNKYDTEANWKAKDPVLLKGEQAFTSDGTNAGKHKIGDGTSKWSALSYAKASLSKGDVTTALGYTPPASNTWRGIQNNLTSDSTSDSLSAAQGKVLKGLVDGKAASSHTHTIAQISNLQSTLDGKSNTNHTHDLNSMINTLTNGTSDPVDTDYYIAQYAGGGSTTTTYHRRPHSALWNYIKSKANSVYQPKGSYAASSHTHDDRYYTETEMNSKLAGKAEKSHTHDDRYYTESEINTKLSGKSDIGHDHQNIISLGAKAPTASGTTANSPASEFLKDGISLTEIYNYGTTPTTYGNIINVIGNNHPGAGQLLLGWSGADNTTEHLYYRSHRDTNTGGWGPWKTVAFTTDNVASASSVPWSGVQDKPSTFPPSSHSHTKSQITDFPAAIKNPNSIKIQLNGGTTEGTNQFIYDGSAAKTINITPSIIGASAFSHTHPISSITSLQTTLDNKAALNHSHSYLPLSGGTLTGQLKINGTAASQPLIVRGIVGSDSNGNLGDLHLQFGANYPIKLGNEAAYSISADGGTYTGKAATAGVADSANAVAWANVSGKPSSYPPSTHTHFYAGSLTVGGSANSAVKLDTSAGSATQPVYFSGGKPVACSYTLGKSVPSNAVFTDTNTTYPISYRTIDNNFASKYRTQTKGNTSAGDYISTLRCNTNSVPYAPQYGTGLGWGREDTHGYLYMNYSSPQVYVGAGNADKLNWAKQLAFADHIHSYTEIANRPTLIKAVSANGYWGMADHDGNDSSWIRTTSNGIIPYQSGGAGAGHCGIGTSSWYFSNAYIDTVNCVNASVSGHIDAAGYIQSSNLINTYFEYQSNRGTIDWRFGSATATGDENFFGFYDAKTGKIPLALDGNFGNIYVGFNVGGLNQKTSVGVYLGEQVAGNRAFIYHGDSYAGSIWIQTRLDGSWKWFSLGRACSTALSDIRLKGDIRDTEVEDATKVIESMKIRSFERKDSHKKYKIGFIADELEQLDPNLVDGGGEVDGHPYYKSVNNLQMLAYVVKGMQELNSKVTILEQENKRLKQRLNMCN